MCSVCFTCTSAGGIITGERRVKSERGDCLYPNKIRVFKQYFLLIPMSITSYNTKPLRGNHTLIVGEEAEIATSGSRHAFSWCCHLVIESVKRDSAICFWRSRWESSFVCSLLDLLPFHSNIRGERSVRIIQILVVGGHGLWMLVDRTRWNMAPPRSRWPLLLPRWPEFFQSKLNNNTHCTSISINYEVVINLEHMPRNVDRAREKEASLSKEISLSSNSRLGQRICQKTVRVTQ